MSDSRYFGRLASEHPDRFQRALRTSQRVRKERKAAEQAATAEAQRQQYEAERDSQHYASRFHQWRMGRMKGLEKQLEEVRERHKTDLDPRLSEKMISVTEALEELRDWQCNLENLVSQFASSLPQNTRVDTARIQKILAERNGKKGAKTRKEKEADKKQLSFDL